MNLGKYLIESTVRPKSRVPINQIHHRMNLPRGGCEPLRSFFPFFAWSVS